MARAASGLVNKDESIHAWAYVSLIIRRTSPTIGRRSTR
jgi:hypothetical protein